MGRVAVRVGAAMAAMCLAGLGAEWRTFGGDRARTGWAKDEKTLSVENVGKLKLEWSLKLENQALDLTALTVPVIAQSVITPKGFKDLVVTAGSEDKLFAIDADTGKLFWQKKFETAPKPKGKPGWLCPDALNATPILIDRTVEVLTSDGMLHSLSILNGEDRAPPVQFTPPFGKPWSLNFYKDVLYTATSQGCRGVKSAVYAMNLKDPARPSAHFQTAPGGAGIWGRAGVAISGITGLAYAETGDGQFAPESGKYADSFVAVTPDMKLADYYTPLNQAWVDRKDLDMGAISPTVFQFGKWELVAGSGKEGVLYMLDAKLLGGADHRTPLYRSSRLANDDVDFAGRGFWGALSTFEDAKHQRWLFAPAAGPPSTEAPKFPVAYGDVPDGSVMAFRVVERDGKPVLDPAWRSVNMLVPEPVVIANGVVFALANGDNMRQVDANGSLIRPAPLGNATLYALDAGTGKVLYSSGKTIPGFTHFSGLAISNGRVYVVTHDSTVYAFGLGDANR